MHMCSSIIGNKVGVKALSILRLFWLRIHAQCRQRGAGHCVNSIFCGRYAVQICLLLAAPGRRVDSPTRAPRACLMNCRRAARTRCPVTGVLILHALQ